MSCRCCGGYLICLVLLCFGQSNADDLGIAPLIGYTELQTNLPGGRHANVRTMRAMVIRRDGTDRRSIGQELANEADAGRSLRAGPRMGRWPLLVAAGRTLRTPSGKKNTRHSDSRRGNGSLTPVWSISQREPRRI